MKLSISEHLKAFRLAQNETQDSFAKKIGISRSSLSQIESKKILPTLETIQNIHKAYSISYDQIFNGQISNTPIAQEDITPYIRRSDRINNQEIPLYNIEATAGLVPLFQDSRNQKPIDHLHIPNLPKCDGAIYVTGDSMYPLLKSGDIICFKEIKDYKTEIFWGEMYLISIRVSGEEYISVKWIQKSTLGPDYVKLVSQK